METVDRERLQAAIIELEQTIKIMYENEQSLVHIEINLANVRSDSVRRRLELKARLNSLRDRVSATADIPSAQHLG